MPVIHVHALQARDTDVGAVAARVAAAAADALGCDARHVWVTWHAAEAYAVGPRVERGAGAPPRDSHDPVAHVYGFAGRDDETVARTLAAVAEALADALGLAPGAGFVAYHELAPGRVYTGGEVRRAT